MGLNGDRKPLILKGRNGGRAGTRTPDLLRVKKRRILFAFHGFPVFAWLYTNSAHLLSRNAELIWMQQMDFWNTFGSLEVEETTRFGLTGALSILLLFLEAFYRGCRHRQSISLRVRPSSSMRTPFSSSCGSSLAM